MTKPMNTKDKLFNCCLLLLAIVFLLVLFAPLVTSYDPNQQDILNKLQHPSSKHWLGTDQLGRDIYTRILYGGRTTLCLSLVTTTVILFFGFLFGWLTAIRHGKLKRIIDFLCDTLLALPSELIVLIVIGILGPNLLTIFTAITLAKWPWFVRMFQSEIKQYQYKNYIQFSKVIGKSNYWILHHHLLRKIIPLVIVYGTLNLSGIIMSISALSFLGIGIQPPTAEWGNMVNEAKNFLLVDYWQLIPVGGVMLIVISALNYLGDQFATQLISTKEQA
ncbi:ABC transporter permease [Enterococcus ratti]|nr:ABC transporter permease [Enterococcus ratti]